MNLYNPTNPPTQNHTRPLNEVLKIIKKTPLFMQRKEEEENPQQEVNGVNLYMSMDEST